ncbi:thiamine pyrophosphate-requiring protein [Chelativorans xinjiangense]|uniref:thiamine pyrophosphate-requiring protein n=1 Tax=Chelativorans xinjiangense TaxID=2681485 RepID=UPI001356AA49|nr:thiamine pyrophosphate-requiring protein [Chelativorans xinjiangense]
MAPDQAEGKTEAEGRTGAEDLLLGLKRAGIDFIFANAGTDFPPIIEAFAALDEGAVPVPVTVPHETASVAMAHGYYLLTGRPQATMVHVNVGLANSAMGVINAASDNIPVLVMSGRTPITEHGRRGARVSPIQYGQEMYDQSSLVSDVVKFHYEMRYPEQGGLLAARAAALAMSEPKGPVYISLPREALMDTVPASAAGASPQVPATVPYPDPAAIAQAAQWLSAAKSPLIVCQRGDPDGRVGAALAEMAETFAVPVVEPFSIRNLMASDHPMFRGYDIKEPLAEADVVLVVDSGVPWIESLHRPATETRIVHLGPDPNFQRMPVRGYQADLAVASDAAAGLRALAAAMEPAAGVEEERRSRCARLGRERLEGADEEAAAGCTSPMSAEWMSRCVSAIMGERAVIFSELGILPGSMRVNGPNRIFSNPHSGGLGWALPAALGAQLADRERLVIACMGDGSYMFANPIACHQIAEALELPVLTIVKNNSMWNAVRRSVVNSYPGGAAAKANLMPLTSLEPSPDYTRAAAASRAYTERVEHGVDLPAALGRAVEVIRKERRQVVLDLKVAISDRY